MNRTLKDMRDTAKAHEQWAMSAEASASEAATSTVFATQIRAWVAALESGKAVDAVVAVPSSHSERPRASDRSAVLPVEDPQ